MEAADAMVADGAGFIVVLGTAEDVLALSDHVADRDILVLNARAEDDFLRVEECRENLLHVASSRAMLADGLAQFLMWKRWREWFLIEGSHPQDKAWAEALRRAAKRFGAKIVEERIFEDTGGARRTDTGHVIVQKQIPVFTQRAEDHDVLVVADESDVFGAYLPYHTWDARPVAGSAGLRPVGWHPANEAWGATQFQRRFEKIAERRVRTLDFQTWLALRVIGEGVTRTGSADPAKVRDYVMSEDFELGIFKGTKVNFRPWNQQLRSPVLLAHDRMIVSVSPQKEYLHKVSQLDTLGYDEPESNCSLN
jgi:ABC transporter substrate binding protein (PQQ-dependent alcohol dehydrogenase system)